MSIILTITDQGDAMPEEQDPRKPLPHLCPRLHLLDGHRHHAGPRTAHNWIKGSANSCPRSAVRKIQKFSESYATAKLGVINSKEQKTKKK